MKRTGEFVLGIIGILITLGTVGLTFLSMSVYDDPNVASMLGDIDIEALKNSALISTIVGVVLSIVALAPTILIFRNRKPIIAGILFLAIGAISFPFGQWIGGALFIIAGLLSLLKMEKKQEYHYSEE